MVSKKLISEIFSHFPFFSKYVNPLIEILIWEVHNDDGNMLSKFQIDPVYRSGAMVKTSFGPEKIQQQQLEGADLNVKPAATAWIQPEDTCIRKQPGISIQATCNHKNQCMQQMTGHSTSQQPFDFQVHD